MSETVQTLRRSIRRHLWGAGLFFCALLAFLIGWFAWMQISGAVIAPGAIVVESNVKTLRHKEGGIVAEIFVRNGDVVQAGDLLLRLDDAVTRANLAVVRQQLDELVATEARLIAERDNAADIVFPESLTRRASDAEISRILTGQRQLREARLAGLVGRTDQLHEQINQLDSQIDNLEVQAEAKAEEIGLIDLELVGLEQLLENDYVATNRVLAVRRDKTRLRSEHGALLAEAARTELEISERRIQILPLQEDYRAETLQRLQETRSEIARLAEQKAASADRLSRMDIRAPSSGFVHQLNVHTRGSFISPAEPVLLIVPNEDALIIETQVAPTDVDQIFMGQQATIRLSGLNQRTTPELTGQVVTISAETSLDEGTGLRFFTVRLRFLEGEREKIGGNILMPGMPVEALIQTGDRTILSYLIKPIRDQIAHAMREE